MIIPRGVGGKGFEKKYFKYYNNCVTGYKSDTYRNYYVCNGAGAKR